jgi:hypothetical protein
MVANLVDYGLMIEFVTSGLTKSNSVNLINPINLSPHNSNPCQTFPLADLMKVKQLMLIYPS